MPLWTLWDKTKPPAQAVIKQHQTSPGTADGSLPVGLDPSLAWLQEMHDPEPAYDPASQKLQRNDGVVVIDTSDTRTGTRTWGWSVVLLTASELRDATRVALLQSEKAVVGAIVQGWIDGETVTAEDAASVARFIAIRDGLDEQAL